MSSYRLSVINDRVLTEAHLILALDYCVRLFLQFDPHGQTTHRCSAYFGYRLDRWGLGYSAVGRTGSPTEGTRSGLYRLLIWRQCASRQDSDWPRLSNPVGRADPAGKQNHDWCGRDDYFFSSGRAHHRDRAGRRGHYRPRTPAGSVLALASSP